MWVAYFTLGGEIKLSSDEFIKTRYMYFLTPGKKLWEGWHIFGHISEVSINHPRLADSTRGAILAMKRAEDDTLDDARRVVTRIESRVNRINEWLDDGDGGDCESNDCLSCQLGCPYR